MSSKSKKDSFKKGDRVSAKWSGSNVFYDAKILDVTSRTYKVQFDDGSVSSVKLAEVKKIATSKEPSPKASKSQSRSRSRSAGRATRASRSRSKSPARREKKKSVSKKEQKSSSKETKSKAKSADNSPNANSNSKTDDSDLKNREKIKELLKEEALRRSPIVTNSYVKESTTTTEKFVGSTERTRSTRLAALKAAEATRDALDSKRTSNAKSQIKAKYSDDEEEEDEVDMPPKVLSNAMKTFYFFATVLRIILLPSVMLFLVFACSKTQCKILDIPKFYAKWRDLGNAVKFPLLYIFLFHLLHCLFPLVPLGRKVMGFSLETKKSAMEYCLNGFLVLMVNIVVFSVAAYFDVYSFWGFEKFRGIAMSCALYSTVWSIGLHIYSLIKGDSTTHTKIPILGKFYNGSYINPVLFKKIDIKTSFIRAGLMGLVLINLSIVLKYVLSKGTVTVPLAMTTGMQTFFVLDMFIREEKILSSATYTTDTVGYSFLLTTGFLIPIGLAFQSVYLCIFETKAAFTPHYCSGAMLALFFFGYYIYLTSSNLKHNFRRNPFSPALSNVNSIPTSRKKRLISSGLWGVVRHPNYLGLLIMATAWSLPCGFTHLAPYGPLLLLALALIVRIFRIETECKEKYGPAWKNYCDTVRSRLVPYVF